MTDLSAPTFNDEAAAREHIEASRWPDGVVCPHCGSLNAMRMEGKTQAGMFLCRDCRDKFTCRTGTAMERSHIPLHKWLLALHLMASSKKGISAHQLMRNLGLGSYRTAWFMAHRIREAMRAPAPKKPVLSLIERDGRVASFHVANVTATTLRPIIVKHASRKGVLMTDEAPVYNGIGKEFAAHHTVNRGAAEYARLSGHVHVNSAEAFFSVLKRGITGIYQHVSEAHLHRYLAEFDFRQQPG